MNQSAKSSAVALWTLGGEAFEFDRVPFRLAVNPILPGDQEMSDLPIACSLSAPELQQRENELLQKVRSAAQEIEEREDGFAYRFPSNATLLADLFSLIQLEHLCCPFLKFTLTVTAGDGPIWLELTGPAGTKQFLTTILG